MFLLTLPATYATGIDLPAIRKMSVEAEVETATLEGDDVTVATHAIEKGGKWDLEGGGVDLPTLALLTGHTMYSSGTTPNEISYINMLSTNQRPYFGIIGRMVTDSAKGVLMQLMQCKCTKSPSVSFDNGKFAVTPCSGMYMADASGFYGRIIIKETAGTISTTWASNLA